MNGKFRALNIEEKNGSFVRNIIEKNITDLPDNEVLINVKYSSLNYKDALSASGHKGITKNFPHTPGIDAAGIVKSSKNKLFKEGDKVLITGYDLGMNTAGGFAEYINVPSSWVVKLPDNLSLKESMIYGTAGFTAALSLYKIEKITERNKEEEFLVTGATGGVGSLSIALLKKAGYKNIFASTGKIDKKDFLHKIGADKIISREDINIKSEKFLLQKKWANAIDTVGGNTLSSLIKSTRYGGTIAACGLTGTFNFDVSVYPFILRGINLIGIASAECKMETRLKIWNKLSSEWKVDLSSLVNDEISLDQLNEKIDLILKGKITGRVIINLEK